MTYVFFLYSRPSDSRYRQREFGTFAILARQAECVGLLSQRLSIENCTGWDIGCKFACALICLIAISRTIWMVCARMCVRVWVSVGGDHVWVLVRMHSLLEVYVTDASLFFHNTQRGIHAVNMERGWNGWAATQHLGLKKWHTLFGAHLILSKILQFERSSA